MYEVLVDDDDDTEENVNNPTNVGGWSKTKGETKSHVSYTSLVGGLVSFNKPTFSLVLSLNSSFLLMRLDMSQCFDWQLMNVNALCCDWWPPVDILLYGCHAGLVYGLIIIRHNYQGLVTVLRVLWCDIWLADKQQQFTTALGALGAMVTSLMLSTNIALISSTQACYTDPEQLCCNVVECHQSL